MRDDPPAGEAAGCGLRAWGDPTGSGRWCGRHLARCRRPTCHTGVSPARSRRCSRHAQHSGARGPGHHRDLARHLVHDRAGRVRRRTAVSRRSRGPRVRGPPGCGDGDVRIGTRLRLPPDRGDGGRCRGSGTPDGYRSRPGPHHGCGGSDDGRPADRGRGGPT